eukprot:scaffold21323_cov60-Phaeocystis_antarctica.AAC.2
MSLTISAVSMDRSRPELYMMSTFTPASHSSLPAYRASFRPCSVSGTSAHPVNLLERFHSDWPCRSKIRQLVAAAVRDTPPARCGARLLALLSGSVGKSISRRTILKARRTIPNSSAAAGLHLQGDKGGALPAADTRTPNSRDTCGPVLPPQRTAAAGSAASAQMQPSSSSSSSAAAKGGVVVPQRTEVAL